MMENEMKPDSCDKFYCSWEPSDQAFRSLYEISYIRELDERDGEKAPGIMCMWSTDHARWTGHDILIFTSQRAEECGWRVCEEHAPVFRPNVIFDLTFTSAKQ